jgi:hypothetical protein
MAAGQICAGRKTWSGTGAGAQMKLRNFRFSARAAGQADRSICQVFGPKAVKAPFNEQANRPPERRRRGGNEHAQLVGGPVERRVRHRGGLHRQHVALEIRERVPTKHRYDFEG